MLTLPIEEVGSRIVWGHLIANRLVPNSLDISNSLIFSQVQHGDCCVTDDEKVSTTPVQVCQLDQQLAEDEQSAGSLSATNKIRFIIASRNLYNRIGVLQRLQKEGWKLSQLKVPEMSIGRLWYSKQLVWKPEGEKSAPESSQICPSEDTTTQSMEMTKNSTSLSVLSWLGLRVQPARSRIVRNIHTDNTEHPVGLTQSGESEENSSATCMTTVNVRMVFVRRESFECGDAICDSIRSSRFPPAKLRRTRLRGTTQSGIKLKRDGRRALPLTENSNSADDSQPSPEKRYRTDHEAALCVLTGASVPSEQSSTIYSYPLPWEEQSGIHHRYDSPLSPTSLIHSSIATRVKRGAYLCRRREDRPNCVDRKVNEPELELNQRAKHDELAFDVVYQPRNRMPPKRFDLTDRDLELALQRFSNPNSQAPLYTAVSYAGLTSHLNESESSSKPITMWTKLTCPLPAPDSTSPRVNSIVGGDHLTALNNHPNGSCQPIGDIRLLTFSSSAWTNPNPSQATGPPNYTTDNTGPLLIQSPNSTLPTVPKTTIQRTNLANEPMLINAMHSGTTEYSLASITNTPSVPTGHTLLTHDKTYPFPIGNAFWPSYCYPTIPHQEQLPCSPQAPILSSPFTEVSKMSNTQQLGYPHSFLPYWDSQVGSPMFHTVPITPIPSSNPVALAFPSSLAVNDCSQNVLYYHPFVNSDQHFPLFSNPVPTISYATLPPTCDTTTALAVFPAPCQLQFIT
ncbi:hypothetical protein EG68_03075 [Paragonimus skrjabini miyazakii]|uniref:Uncharacterized protein n=1 Tax=Paragonimus skrjabini miyazakii TaxID=59628 RepID=A0A8S9YW36_9TREM|nr:hypothetical protein EG68_03075 [Paragonimus skrjabini miyazakii]